jgi:hypothetical protein
MSITALLVPLLPASVLYENYKRGSHCWVSLFIPPNFRERMFCLLNVSQKTNVSPTFVSLMGSLSCSSSVAVFSFSFNILICIF